MCENDIPIWDSDVVCGTECREMNGAPHAPSRYKALAPQSSCSTSSFATTMSSYLSSLAEKAQNAFNESPLAAQVQQLQSKVQQHSSGPSAGTQQPTANDPAAQGDTGVAGKSPLMGNLTHQLRNFQMQYSCVGCRSVFACVDCSDVHTGLSLPFRG